MRFSQITDLPGAESSPSLSPDGKTLAFVGRVQGHADVYVQRVGGHNPINLTADCPKDDTGPAFSADGERIAYHSDCEGGGLFVMGATGESRRRVADFGYDPTWSPDGRSIAVASEPTLNPLSRNAESTLSIIDLASGGKRLLLDQDAMQPAWSPDGRRIAFWNLRGGPGGTGRRDIWTVAASGGPAVEVTNDEDVDWSPVWSPDSRHLYFCERQGQARSTSWCLRNRHLIDSDGRPGRPSPSPLRPAPSGSFSLSRDGSRLAFEAREERSPRSTGADFDPASGRAGTPALHPRRLARDLQPRALAGRTVDRLGQRGPAREPVRGPDGRDGLPPAHRRQLQEPRSQLVERRKPDQLLLESLGPLRDLERARRRQQRRSDHEHQRR